MEAVGVPRTRGKRLSSVTPAQSLLLGCTLITVLGALLLTFPLASAERTSQPFIDAVFTATSAVTTTGLGVVDTGSYYSLFGQMVILVLSVSAFCTAGFSLFAISFVACGDSAFINLTIAVLTVGGATGFFWRRIPEDTVRRALTIGFLATVVTVLATLVLTTTEGAPFLGVLFEVVSALGTVGLSTGITAGLTTVGKVILCITMLIGRLGPLAIGFALMARPGPGQIRYAQEDVFIG